MYFFLYSNNFRFVTIIWDFVRFRMSSYWPCIQNSTSICSVVYAVIEAHARTYARTPTRTHAHTQLHCYKIVINCYIFDINCELLYLRAKIICIIFTFVQTSILIIIMKKAVNKKLTKIHIKISLLGRSKEASLTSELFLLFLLQKKSFNSDKNCHTHTYTHMFYNTNRFCRI